MVKRIYKKPSPRSIKNHPLYNTWAQMKGRCFNTKRDNFRHYGGRGVIVCQRWKDSFECFVADVGLPPSDLHTLDRKDTNGHYSCGHCVSCRANSWPANLQWATPKAQARNKRNNHKLEIDGIVRTVSEWAERSGMSREVLDYRLNIGMPPADAVSKPLRKYTKAGSEATP